MKEDNIHYVGTLFGKVCSDIFLKCLGVATIIISEFFVDSILSKAMLAVFCLVIFDWVTGIFAAKISGEHIKSSKIIRTPIKIAIYFMLIASARIAEYSLPDVIRYLDETVIAFLALTELISLLENTGKMGYAIPKKLLNKLKSMRDEK